MATMSNEQLITLAKAAHGIAEEAHTYARWRSMGYQVRKGEHAAFSATIWKYAPGKGAAENEAPANEGDAPANEGARMFLKKAHFFTASQVDAAAATA